MGDKRSSLAFQALLMTIMYTLASVGAGDPLEHHHIATVLSGHLPPVLTGGLCVAGLHLATGVYNELLLKKGGTSSIHLANVPL